MLCNGVVSLFV